MHLVIKLTKIGKDKILKATRGKKDNIQGNCIKLSTDFLTETLQAQREWHNILK